MSFPLTEFIARGFIAARDSHTRNSYVDAWGRIEYQPAPMSPGDLNPIWGWTQYRPASCRQDRLDAFGLVYRRYVESRLIDSNPFQLRVTPFHLLPTTTVFIGSSGGTVFGTVSLIADGSLGLPLEDIYPKEIGELRASGLSLAEVSCLALNGGVSKRQFRMRFLEINRLLAQYARCHGIDGLVIAIHPHHAGYYRRLMGFEQVGDVSCYPSVRNHPAVACYLDFAKADETRPPTYDAIFGRQIPVAQLHCKPMSSRERRALEPVTAMCGQHVPLAVA